MGDEMKNNEKYSQEKSLSGRRMVNLRMIHHTPYRQVFGKLHPSAIEIQSGADVHIAMPIELLFSPKIGNLGDWNRLFSDS